MMWSTERASWTGFVECMAGAVVLPASVILLQQAGFRYLDPVASVPRFVIGAGLLIVFGIVAFRIAKRHEYPWLLALAAVALPLFDPTQAPYHGTFRVVVAARDLVLIGATVIFIGQSVRRADELERKIHLEAVAWTYSAAVIGLLLYTMAADVLPPLRATWVASALLAGVVVAWLVSSARYQREEPVA